MNRHSCLNWSALVGTSLTLVQFLVAVVLSFWYVVPSDNVVRRAMSNDDILVATIDDMPSGGFAAEVVGTPETGGLGAVAAKPSSTSRKLRAGRNTWCDTKGINAYRRLTLKELETASQSSEQMLDVLYARHQGVQYLVMKKVLNEAPQIALVEITRLMDLVLEAARSEMTPQEAIRRLRIALETSPTRWWRDMATLDDGTGSMKYYPIIAATLLSSLSNFSMMRARILVRDGKKSVASAFMNKRTEMSQHMIGFVMTEYAPSHSNGRGRTTGTSWAQKLCESRRTINRLSLPDMAQSYLSGDVALRNAQDAVFQAFVAERTTKRRALAGRIGRRNMLMFDEFEKMIGRRLDPRVREAGTIKEALLLIADTENRHVAETLRGVIETALSPPTLMRVLLEHQFTGYGRILQTAEQFAAGIGRLSDEAMEHHVRATAGKPPRAKQRPKAIL